MTDTVETRIKLPGEVHRAVKAEAARHGITLAEALGMCVAFISNATTPLLWRTDGETVADDLREYAEELVLPF